MALNVRNPTTGQACKDWSVSGIVQKDVPSAGWSDIDIYFRGPVTPFKSTDIFSFRLHGVLNAAAGDDLYYDGMSVFGPVLRPGVATW